MASVDSKAKAMLRREPEDHDFAGVDYSEASRMAVAICRAAGETGQTVAASKYLAGYADILQPKG